MSPRNTIIVLILLLVIGGYALYVNHQPPPETNPKVYHLDAKDVKTIDLHSSDRDIALERTSDTDWKITKPVPAKADAPAVEAMLNQIVDLTITDTADASPSDLAPFGLAVPAVTVTITTKDGKTMPAILVGKQTPVGGSVFIKMADKPEVVLVASSFATDVNKHEDDLRSHALFSFKPEDAHKITITHGGQTVELKRTGNKWEITQPKAFGADKDAVSGFLNLLANSTIHDFVDDKPADLSKYGLGTPALTIALSSADNQPAEVLRFGFKQPEASSNNVFARTGDNPTDPVYTVPSSLITTASKSFDDLRDKTVLHFDPATVARINFKGGPVDETIERSADNKWMLTSGGKNVAAEQLVAQSLLDQMHDLKATKIAENPMSDPNKYGMVKPTVTITLSGKDGKTIATLYASILQVTVTAHSSDEKSQNKSFGYVTATTDTAVFEVPPQAITDLENTGNRLHTDLTGTPTPSPSPAAATPQPSASAK